MRRAIPASTLLAAIAAGCGDSGRPADSATVIPPETTVPVTDGAPTSTTDGTTDDVPTTGTAGATESAGTTAGACSVDSCPDGTCVGDICCDVALACGALCCAADQVCSFQQCVVPGAECVDAAECGDGNYCEYTLGQPGSMGGDQCGGGFMPATGKCLPEPPECDPGVVPEGDDIDCLPKCEYKPQTSFEPVLKYAWTDASVMMPPIVIQLDDDDCNGEVDERDIPEIVFMSFDDGNYSSNGTLHAISIVDGALVTKWTAKPAVDTLFGGRALAGGNIDGVAGNEIVACTAEGKVRAYTAAGAELWITAAAVGCDHISLADLDGDGNVEVLTESSVLDGKTGALELTIDGITSSWWNKKSIAADVTGDGKLEIVTPTRVLAADGTVLADTGLGGTFPAVADFDLDGVPEIVGIDNVHGTGTHDLNIWRYDANAPGGFVIVRQDIDINGPLSPDLCPAESAGNIGGGGPPTIADFNGDGTPDIGVAGGIGYAVFDGKKLIDPNVAPADTFLWIKQTQDCSSAFTGSSVFDFDGSGSAEVVYADEQYMRIYDGATGDVLLQVCNTSGTLHEYPLVADVDNDGQADIVVTSNDYSSLICPTEQMKTRGVRIFGDANNQWVRTRRIWNQHAYHVTNVAEDGTIPTVEASNWTTPGLNNFRQNVQPEGEFAAPDLVVSGTTECFDGFRAHARVRNLGQAAVPAGVPVGFYEGDPDQGGLFLGSGITTKVLYPAEAQELTLELPDIPPGFIDGSKPLVLIVDDGAPDHPWHECRTDNNKATLDPACKAIG
ncbi:FG-GAP-like repeat-containing protein [Nannocystis pusilla]|uniref:FG-GAP repeat protein n=1 Tax=Nannocystis pusilla TaxID=889268 RepID=A0ABS7TPS3_9BACT|nr:FG-GAP-like repeat-containing protein [Nannocystis pusilla]MBZ5710242.1 hypothetical protein [Nannocystis pusilla]